MSAYSQLKARFELPGCLTSPNPLLFPSPHARKRAGKGGDHHASRLKDTYNLCVAVLLRRFDPEENVNRWYWVHVQPTLFEPIAVSCAWGSYETAWQQMRILPASSAEEAQAIAEKIAATKLKRGYRRVRE